MYSAETLRCMGAHRQYFVTTTMKGSKFTKIRAFSFVSTRPGGFDFAHGYAFVVINTCFAKTLRLFITTKMRQLQGRLMAIVDVYDTLISKRVYKEAWPYEWVIELIAEEKGKQFDPQIVDVFLEVLKMEKREMG